MGNWRESIDLNKTLSESADLYDLSRVEEDCPEGFKTAVANKIKESSILAYLAPKIEASVSIAEFTRVLEEVFDIADDQKVWLGFL